MAGARHWTHEELMTLTDGAGRVSFGWIQKRVGDPGYSWPRAPKLRSRRAIYAQFARLHGAGGLSRGSTSLRQALEDTGYSRSQLIRARDALHQQWRRLTSRGTWLIMEDQIEDIVSWLRADYWSKAKRLPGCVWCGTTSVPMRSAGLCSKDYGAYQRLCIRLGVPVPPRKQECMARSAGLPDEALALLASNVAIPRRMLVSLARAG